MEHNDISSNFIKTKNNQIFKYFIPKKIILDFLNIIKYHNDYKLFKNENKFIINKIIYKKLIFNDNIDEFINNIKPYYNKKKIFYVDRKINYKSFLTIIRQVCKLCKIEYENKIKYNYSKYEIYYIINIPQAINACK